MIVMLRELVFDIFYKDNIIHVLKLILEIIWELIKKYIKLF